MFSRFTLPALSIGTVSFSPVYKALPLFDLPGLFKIKVLPAQIGSHSENSAIVEKCRYHSFLDVKGTSVESLVSLPFESEPKILRSWTFLGNHAQITTDLRIGGRCHFDKIEIDSLEIEGNWKQIKILQLSTSQKLQEAKWTTLVPAEADKIILQQNNSWLIAIIEKENGERVEISCGDDLWRCGICNQESQLSQFSITQTAEKKLIFSKVLAQWPESLEWQQRTWRSSWNIAYSNIPKKSTRRPQYDAIIDFTNEIMTDSATRINGDDGFCLVAGTTLSHLKNWVRSFIGKQQGVHLAVINLNIGICNNSSHCSRPKKESLIHWDLSETLSFWLWANRQLAKYGGSLVIIPDPKSPVARIPSLFGLTQVNLLKQDHSNSEK